MNELINPWRRVGDFNGRATRKEFWSGVIQFTLVFAAFIVITITLSEAGASAPVFVSWSLFFLAMLIFLTVCATSVGIRRIHDFDVTGWLVLTFYIPYLGWIAAIVVGCIPGTAGPNRWGADPRGGPALQQVFS